MSLMQYHLEVPINIRLKLDSARIEQAIGGKVATSIRRLLNSGKAPGGKSLRTPKDHGESGSTSKAPLRRSGQLIRSIRYSRSSGTVGPSGHRKEIEVGVYRKKSLLKRPDAPGGKATYAERGAARNRQKRNYAIYSILVASHLQPGLEVDDAMADLMSKTAEDAIAKQLAKPGKGLVGELKRISRGYK